MLPFEHIVILDRKSNIPVYKQIAFSIINAIQTGILKASMKLPGSRDLSQKLGVHRKTVIAAYEELYSQDWIVIIPRKHVYVSDQIPQLKPQGWKVGTNETPYKNSFDLPFKRIASENLLGLKNGSFLELIIDDGYPDVRLSPIDELLKNFRSSTGRKYAIRNAHIGIEQGTIPLRKELVQYLAETRGLNITEQNIVITHGAQMSIYLASQLLLNEGSTIIVGNPNYKAANATFLETGASLIEVKVDENGLDINEVEEHCRKYEITAVYVIPHHHYPTTATLSVERRIKLLELSKEFSFAIIEDDYDYDYHYSSSPYLPLASANHCGNVLYIGSFSKILDPSLRIGFMIASTNFINQCIALRKLIDVGGMDICKILLPL